MAGGHPRLVLTSLTNDSSANLTSRFGGSYSNDDPFTSFHSWFGGRPSYVPPNFNPPGGFGYPRQSGPFFNEFTIELPRSARIVNGYLLREKIVGPLPLGQNYPELTKNALVCVTETTSREDIERLVAGVRRALEQPL